MLTRKASFLGLISFFLAGIALGGEAIPNWPAPATWSPARTRGGLSAMDVTNPLPFIGLAPCRIADTRNPPGPYGAPALTGGVPRNFTLTGQCGIPSSAGAVSLNVTVTNTQGPGFILIYPQGGSQPTVSTLNYVANETIANAAVVPLGSGNGGITVIAGVSGTDLIIDVNGYYADSTFNQLAPGEYFEIQGSVVGAVISGINRQLATLGYGVEGSSNSTGSGSAGVLGLEGATTGLVYGVEGILTSITTAANHSAGVYGQSQTSTGYTYGVQGHSFSTTGGGTGIPGGAAAGVAGVEASGFPAGSSNLAAGVLGASKTRVGVQGDSSNVGVRGDSYDSAGNFVTAGLLGFNGGVGGPYGVFSTGNFTATGTKMFIEPHPTDPSKVVRFVSLEGNESGTYFRGSAQIVNGTAVIPVPEEFRMVTDEEGLTVQLTPVGTLATMCVVSEDLNQIVVRSNRDIKFHYQVNGIRRAYKDFVPIVDGQEFMPNSPSAVPLGSYPAEIRQRLVANGTYNADSTVNMETAERLGWAKASRDREEQAKAAAAASAAAHAAGLADRR